MKIIQNLLNVLVLKPQRKKKQYRLCTGFLNCTRIQQMHVSPLHIKYVLQNEFLNLFPISLSLYTPKLGICIKMANSCQIITSLAKFWPYHSITK